MGCDGGTIPKRHELVKTKKKAEQKDKNADLIAQWKYCALSNEPLREPVVACELGRLYNKDAVIEYLLDKSDDKAEKMSHIKGLKDIHSLNLHHNPAWKSKTEHADKGDGYIDDQNAKYICPIAGIEMNGRYKFCYLRPCGCVFSSRALNEVKDENCPTCSIEYSRGDDVIAINGGPEVEVILYQKMEARKGVAKSERKKKKDKRKREANGIANHTNGVVEQSSDDRPSTSGQSAAAKKTEGGSKVENVDQNTKVNGAQSTVMKKPQEGTHVKKLEVDNTVNGAKRKIVENKIYKSDVFKSLFTSHSTAKRSKDQRAHWVTYNPYH